MNFCILRLNKKMNRIYILLYKFLIEKLYIYVKSLESF